MKGKKDPVAVFVPNLGKTESPFDPFPQIKVHQHFRSVQWLVEVYRSFQEGQEEKGSIWQECIGREKQLKEIKLKLDRFLKGKDSKGIYVLYGGYAVGKSLILKTILRKIWKVKFASRSSYLENKKREVQRLEIRGKKRHLRQHR